MLRPRLSHPSPAMVVALVALCLNVTGITYAATGGAFILGHANTATTTTALAGSVSSGPVLSMKNTAPGQPAAAFKVSGGAAPFTVSSSTKVSGLNADLLDGSSASAFVAKNAIVPMDAPSIDFGVTKSWDIGPYLTFYANCYTSSDGTNHLDELLLNNAPETGFWYDSEMVETTSSTEAAFGHTGDINSGFQAIVTSQADPSPSKYVGVDDTVTLIWTDQTGEVITATYVGIVYANYCGLEGTLIGAK